MKISKFVQTVKNTGQCIVIHTNDEIYLSNGYGIYKAAGIPDITGKSQIAAVLDIEPKKLKKIMISEDYYEHRDEISGFDFSGGAAPGEIGLEKIDVAAVIDGNIYAAFRAVAGEILFFNEQLLNPIKDVIKDEESYLNYVARPHPDGHKYIAVKDGFEVIAVILPVKVATEKYLSKLREFYTMCRRQYDMDREAQRPDAWGKDDQEDGTEKDE